MTLIFVGGPEASFGIEYGDRPQFGEGGPLLGGRGRTAVRMFGLGEEGGTGERQAEGEREQGACPG